MRRLINFLMSGFRKGKQKRRPVRVEERIEGVPLSGDAINLDELRDQDRGGGVKFDYTENAEVARGAEKAPAQGLDSFGEKDTYDIEEADDYQTDRDRNQNSDLNQRYFTHGMKPDTGERRP